MALLLGIRRDSILGGHCKGRHALRGGIHSSRIFSDRCVSLHPDSNRSVSTQTLSIQTRHKTHILRSSIKVRYRNSSLLSGTLVFTMLPPAPGMLKLGPNHCCFTEYS